MFLPLQSQTKQGNKNKLKAQGRGDKKTERFEQDNCEKYTAVPRRESATFFKEMSIEV